MKPGGKDGSPVRRYEVHMLSALKAYQDALVQATKIEEDGRHLADQAGGSAHGSTEVLYRLHATRLKCLIYAVSCNEDDIHAAELEAMRLTERYWYRNPDSDEHSTRAEKNIRDRVWDVLADVVGGLAQCRQIHPFFHRSVYRQ